MEQAELIGGDLSRTSGLSVPSYIGEEATYERAYQAVCSSRLIEHDEEGEPFITFVYAVRAVEGSVSEVDARAVVNQLISRDWFRPSEIGVPGRARHVLRPCRDDSEDAQARISATFDKSPPEPLSLEQALSQALVTRERRSSRRRHTFPKPVSSQPQGGQYGYIPICLLPNEERLWREFVMRHTWQEARTWNLAKAPTHSEAELQEWTKLANVDLKEGLARFLKAGLLTQTDDRYRLGCNPRSVCCVPLRARPLLLAPSVLLKAIHEVSMTAQTWMRVYSVIPRHEIKRFYARVAEQWPSELGQPRVEDRFVRSQARPPRLSSLYDGSLFVRLFNELHMLPLSLLPTDIAPGKKMETEVEVLAMTDARYQCHAPKMLWRNETGY